MNDLRSVRGIGDKRFADLLAPRHRVTPFPWGPAAALLAVVAGIFGGQAAGAGAAVGVLLLAAAVVAAGALATRAPAVRAALLVASLGLLGVAVMQRALQGLEHSPLTAAVTREEDATVTVALLDDPDASRFATRVLVRVDSRDGHDAGSRRVLVRASGDVAARLRILAAGEQATLRGWFGPLDGFDASWRWKHAVGAFHATALSSAARTSTPVMRAANAVRDFVLRGTRGLSPVDRALLAGFLLGDTRGVPPSLTDDFRASGLSHLTAVSGENVAFVLALVAPVLRRLSLRGRLAGALAVLALFGTMTRWEPSVLRAVVMAAMALVAGFLGRPQHGVRILVLAATVLLLVDPFLVHSVGFVLSCAASLGITLLARPIAARLPGPAWFREVLGVTAAAQLAVAPVIIPVFGAMPLVALPANLVAVPLAAPLTGWGLFAGLVGGVAGRWAPGVPAVLAVPTTALLHGLVTVAEVAAGVPLAIDGRAAWGIVAAGAAIAAMARLRRARAI
ncbi:MAG: ComEC/Rec2 family competence protein [Acidimicrobiia bacterium]